MIHIEKIVKHFGRVHALDGLDLHVEPGMVYGFLGPNGAGKTTTMRILSGLARPDQGKAWIADQPVGVNKLAQRRLIGVLPEEPSFYTWLTAREYLRDFIAPLFGLDAKEAARRTDEILEKTGLTYAADRRIAGFSRGMRQRLGLAQATIHQPKVLLLDEPLSALDPAGRKEVLDLMESFRGQVTLLFSTHILADVDRICDVIGIINQGKMVTEAGRDDLLARYAVPLFEVESDHPLEAWLDQVRQYPFVERAELENHTARILVKERTLAQITLLASLAQAELPVRRFEMLTPSLEDVFLRVTNTAVRSD